VLFLCVANSARSVLAEALARARFGDAIRFQSAGSQPTRVNPMAIEVLEKKRIATNGLRSKSVDEIDPATIDLVVTLCAEEACPTGLYAARRVHWPVPDPAGPPQTEAATLERRTQFQRALRRIEARLDALRSALALPAGIVLAPATSTDRAHLDALIASCDVDRSRLDATFPADCVVARLDGVVVGAAGLDRGTGGADPRAVLAFVAVSLEHRRKRIGEALVADRLAWARSLQDRYGQNVVASVAVPSHIVASLDPRVRRMLENTGLVRDGDQLVRRFFFTNAELLAQGIAKELAEHGTIMPPYVKYPDIPYMSIGWRMGNGEWYLWMWSTWFEKLSATEQTAYVAKWQSQTPAEWKGFYEDDQEDDEEDGEGGQGR
jgi:arsenate reductase (thioredoxin)